MKKKRKISTADILIAFLLIVCGLMCLIPILNTVAISFSDKTSAAMGRVGLWPINFNVAGYRAILEEKQFFHSFFVSVRRVAAGTALNMSLTILMAYPLSKEPGKFRAKKYYMWIVIFLMMFNGGIVPNFILVKNLNLMDTIWALILPGAVPVFNVILLMNFFKGIPDSLEEAAVIDGANPLQILIIACPILPVPIIPAVL